MNLITNIYHQKFRKGFTLVELIVTIGIFAILAALSSLNFFSTYSQSKLGAAQEVLLADLKTAQSNAMSGKGDTGVGVDGWGLKVVSSSQYQIFPGSTYASNPLNIVTNLGSDLTVTTTFPNDEIVFESVSGNVVGYLSGQDTITLSSGGNSRVIRLNGYGTHVGD